MKDLHVAKRIDVKLQTLQFDATLVGNILEPDGGEIREVGKGADSCEFRNLEIDLYLAPRKFISESVEWKQIHFFAWYRADIKTLLISGRERTLSDCHELLLDDRRLILTEPATCCNSVGEEKDIGPIRLIGPINFIGPIGSPIDKYFAARW